MYHYPTKKWEFGPHPNPKGRIGMRHDFEIVAVLLVHAIDAASALPRAPSTEKRPITCDARNLLGPRESLDSSRTDHQWKNEWMLHTICGLCQPIANFRVGSECFARR